ncbi:MAG: hypothetical protein LUQ31_02360 [Methanoregula sp.]|nr:hypothetical protein [Methanoregula sp.]
MYPARPRVRDEPAREADLRELPWLAIDAIIQERPDVLVHAGDLFDTVKPKTRAYTTALREICKKPIAPFFPSTAYSSPPKKGRPVQARYFAG